MGRYDDHKLGFKIYDDKGKIIKYDKSSLILNFVNPFGQKSDGLDSTILGLWQIDVLYDECSAVLPFNVAAKVEPKIELESTKVTVKVGNSAFLRKFIRSANNSFDEDVTSKVKIKAATGQTIKIENDILSGDILGKSCALCDMTEMVACLSRGYFCSGIPILFS